MTAETARHGRRWSSPSVRSYATRKDWIILAVFLSVSLSVRGLYYWEAAGEPTVRQPGVDAAYHDYWARGLATGDWRVPRPYSDPMIQQRPYLRPPGYPHLLAAVYWVCGPSRTAAAVMQMGLGVVSCLLVWLIGMRWFGRPTAIVAASVMATYGLLVYFELTLLAPAVLVVMVLLLLYALGRWAERPTLAWAIGVGVIAGLTALVRPNILLLVVLVPVWGYWAVKTKMALRRYVAQVGAMLVTCAVMIAPATIRNWRVAGDPVGISANFGINLYIGNSEFANGYVVDELPGLSRFATCFDYPSVVRSVARSVGSELTYSQVSSHFAGMATAYMRQHPRRTAELLVKKTLLFWGPLEIAHNQTPHFDRVHSRVLRVLPSNFALLASAGLLGVLVFFVSTRRQAVGLSTSPSTAGPSRAVVAVIVLFVGCWFVSFVPFFVASRYRVPIIPPLILLGSFGATYVGAMVAQRRFALAVGCVVALACLYGVARVNWGGYEPSLAQWHHHRAVALDVGGHYGEAIDEYGRVIELRPDHDEAHSNLGVLLASQGHVQAAMAHYAKALELRPDRAEVHNNYAILLAQSGQPAQAYEHWRQALRFDPDLAEAHSNLAALLIGAGAFGEAVGHLDHAIRIKPDHVAALESLTWLLATCPDDSVRDGARAVTLGESLIRLTGPDVAGALDTLGAAYAEAGRFPDAIGTAQRAVSVARAQQQLQQARVYRARLRWYRQGQPFREGVGAP